MARVPTFCSKICTKDGWRKQYIQLVQLGTESPIVTCGPCGVVPNRDCGELGIFLFL